MPPGPVTPAAEAAMDVAKTRSLINRFLSSGEAFSKKAVTSSLELAAKAAGITFAPTFETYNYFIDKGYKKPWAAFMTVLVGASAASGLYGLLAFTDWMTDEWFWSNAPQNFISIKQGDKAAINVILDQLEGPIESSLEKVERFYQSWLGQQEIADAFFKIREQSRTASVTDTAVTNLSRLLTSYLSGAGSSTAGAAASTAPALDLGTPGTDVEDQAPPEPN